jgi:hypothetical protein
MDFVDKPSIQQLLDGVGTMDSNGLASGGGSGLVHGASDAVGHEMDSRVGLRPSGGNVMRKYECWSPCVVSIPAAGNFESPSAGQHGHQVLTRDCEGVRRSARTP